MSNQYNYKFWEQRRLANDKPSSVKYEVKHGTRFKIKPNPEIQYENNPIYAEYPDDVEQRDITNSEATTTDVDINTKQDNNQQILTDVLDEQLKEVYEE